MSRFFRSLDLAVAYGRRLVVSRSIEPWTGRGGLFRGFEVVIEALGPVEVMDREAAAAAKVVGRVEEAGMAAVVVVVVDRSFEVVGRGFEVAGRGFEVAGRGFEVAGREFEVAGRGFEVVDREATAAANVVGRVERSVDPIAGFIVIDRGVKD